MSREEHWQTVYSSKPVDRLGWYVRHLHTSINWIEALGLGLDAPILDVGGGASTLVDDLLSRGHRSVSVLDISSGALAAARERLKDDALSVTWLHGDVLALQLPQDHFALWHDRAAFHFLLMAEEQQRYVDKIRGALKTGGNLIVATFDLKAPPECSGLPVMRYSVGSLQSALGDDFILQRHRHETHRTPSGLEQAYVYCQFQKAA